MGRKHRGKAIHGWIIIDKPGGLSSNAVVGRVRRLTGAAKVGHAGTLDPMATGVLPMALGEATKIVSYLMDGAKRTGSPSAGGNSATPTTPREKWWRLPTQGQQRNKSLPSSGTL